MKPISFLLIAALSTLSACSSTSLAPTAPLTSKPAPAQQATSPTTANPGDALALRESKTLAAKTTAASEPSTASVARPVPSPAASTALLGQTTAPDQGLQSIESSPRSIVELAAPTDLWDRIRRGFAMPDLDTELVHDRELWYSKRPDYIERMTDRSSKYLFHIVEELELRGMPTELALLPFIESAFNPQAVSSAKAAGMWQFMPATGKHFDLKQNAFRDDRRDVLASTRAALDYLERLHTMFGDWHLALAAYNWGEGNVQRAIAKSKRAGDGTGYTDIRMPAETRLYVPKLQAVKNIVQNPQLFTVELPDIPNHPYFDSVTILRDIDVALAIQLADVSLTDFRSLNPSINKPVILAAGTPQILLPWDNAENFKHNLATYRGRLASWTAWVAPKTLHPKDAAKLTGMSEANLRSVNNIPPRMLIKTGSTLVVPRAENGRDVAEHIAEHGQVSFAPEVVLRRVTVKAGKYETVLTIAHKYKVSPENVAQWNKVGSTRAAFRVGQSVVLILPANKARAATHSSRATPTKGKVHKKKR